MTKKILIVLTSLLLTELLAIVTFMSSFAPWQGADLHPAQKKLADYGIQNLELPETLVLSSPEQSWTLNRAELAALGPLRETLQRPGTDPSLTNYFVMAVGASNPLTNPNNSPTIKNLELNEQAVGEYLLGLAQAINREPQDAILVIEKGRATQFTPHRSGQILDLQATRKLLKQILLAGRNALSLPLTTSEPGIKLSDLNTLGIKELLVSGQSDFSGSSASRIQNIQVGSSQYNGLIIPPGEEFSFNKNIGPIDAKHGYLPELVIKPEGTVPEFGGGLCQVSSTAFRAAFFAGLPITARRNHSYAVRYYEWIRDDAPRAVGLDATIYPGAQDMKFINDTPSAILIWTRVEGKRLYFDFYGTPDGRKVIVDGPHPYDRKSDGSVKSKVTRTVISPRGEPIEATFNSRYVSPNLYPRTYEYPKTPTPPPSETPPSPPPPTN